MVNQNEDGLVDGIRAGNRTALARYIEQRRPALLAVIRKNMSDALMRKVDPQDIFQDTVIHALNALKDVDLGRVSPHTWLCRLAEQRIVDAHRRLFGARKRSANLEVGLYNPRPSEHSGAFIDVLVASLTTPTQAIARDQKTQALINQFDRLSDNIREAVKLRYIDGSSLQEIAKTIGKSEGAVRVMLSRGVKKLRDSVDDP